MVTKVYIKDNSNSPVRYISELDNFKNGTQYTFKEGVNVIVGENGCGKTTLLNLIRSYLLVDEKECDKGMFNSNINKLFRTYENKTMLDGVDVYADYEKNVFRLCHATETSDDATMKDFDSFGTFFTQKHASTGEGVSIALTALFNMMFSKNAKLRYDYSQLKETYPLYLDYIDKHKDVRSSEWTILMDEPDRNLDINRIDEIKGILSFHKEFTQIIATIHNPLLIYSLSKNKEINFIEMTDGYVNKVCKIIDNIINN